jgi:hypothetical protein
MKENSKVLSSRLAVKGKEQLESDMRVSGLRVGVPQGNYNADVEYFVSQKEMKFCQSTLAVHS